MAESIASKTFLTDGLASGRRHAIAVLYFGLAAIVLYPVFATQLPGLVDFPNHIARLHILGNLDADPVLATNYQENWGVMPNLAMDALLYPFAKLVSVELLGRIFVAAIMLMLLGGTMALSSAVHGRLSCWPALAGLLVYNHMLTWGFANYLFGIGLCLFAFAAWIATGNRNRWLRLAVFSAITSLLFFAHLFALTVYGLCVTAYEVGRLLAAPSAGRRKILREQVFAAGQFVIPALIVFGSKPETGVRDFTYGTGLDKLRAVWSPTLMYSELIDLAVFAFLIVVIVVGSRLKPARTLRWPLIVLTVAALAMPYYMLGAWGAAIFGDMRLPVVIMLLLVAGLPPDSVRFKIGIAIVSIGAALALWRVDSVTARWQNIDRQFAEFRRALTVVERGAAVLPVQYQYTGTYGTQYGFEPNYWHMTAFAIIDRSAFVPHVFTDPAKQPVSATARRATIDSSAGRPVTRDELRAGADREYARTTPRANQYGSSRYWLNWQHRFDYAVVIHFGKSVNPYPDLLRPVAHGSFFDIYRISPATCITLDVKDIPGTCWPEARVSGAPGD